MDKDTALKRLEALLRWEYEFRDTGHPIYPHALDAIPDAMKDAYEACATR